MLINGAREQVVQLLNSEDSDAEGPQDKGHLLSRKR